MHESKEDMINLTSTLSLTFSSLKLNVEYNESCGKPLAIASAGKDYVAVIGSHKSDNGNGERRSSLSLMFKESSLS